MSIQRSLNEMLGSIGQVYYQATAPERFAKEQAEAQRKAAEEQNKKAWDKLSQAEKAAAMETESAEQAVADFDDKEIYDEEELQFFEDLTKAQEKHAKIKEAIFDFDPTSDTLSAMQEYQYYARNSRDWLNRQRQKAKEAAEASALDSIQNKTQGHVEQKSQLEQRLEMLKELNKEGIMSNTQTKKYIRKLGGNQ